MSNTASLKKEYAERIVSVFFDYANPRAQKDCNQSRFGYGRC